MGRSRGKLERLNALQRLVKGMIKFPMLGDPALQDRLEVGEVADVDDLIDALHECGHRIIGGKALAEQDHEIFAPPRVRAFCDLAQNWVCLQGGILEALVDHEHIVAVGLKLDEHVFFE